VQPIRRSEAQTAVGVALAFAPDSRKLALTGPDSSTLKVMHNETGSELWKAA
jgi:hypothetical protein